MCKRAHPLIFLAHFLLVSTECSRGNLLTSMSSYYKELLIIALWHSTVLIMPTACPLVSATSSTVVSEEAGVTSQESHPLRPHVVKLILNYSAADEHTCQAVRSRLEAPMLRQVVPPREFLYLPKCFELQVIRPGTHGLTSRKERDLTWEELSHCHVDIRNWIHVLTVYQSLYSIPIENTCISIGIPFEHDSSTSYHVLCYPNAKEDY